jgi:hypothetical protein
MTEPAGQVAPPLPRTARVAPQHAWWRPLALARDALFLREAAFESAAGHASPFGYGALILAMILALVGLASLAGLALGLMTSPRVGYLEQTLLNALTGMSWYSHVVTQNPAFADSFGRAYGLAWQAIRAALGVPIPAVSVAGFVALAAGVFLQWLAFGAIAHGVARWFGGRARWAEFMAALSLMFAPLLLTIVELVPGAHIPAAFLALAQLAMAYLAVKTTYRLTTGNSIVIALSPYFILTAALLILVTLGLGAAIGRIPYIDTILRGIRFVEAVR